MTMMIRSVHLRTAPWPQKIARKIIAHYTWQYFYSAVIIGALVADSKFAPRTRAPNRPRAAPAQQTSPSTLCRRAARPRTRRRCRSPPSTAPSTLPSQWCVCDVCVGDCMCVCVGARACVCVSVSASAPRPAAAKRRIAAPPKEAGRRSAIHWRLYIGGYSAAVIYRVRFPAALPSPSAPPLS